MAGITIDIPEPFPTLEENARQKARTIYQMTNTATFGEDTGLEVIALNGLPGVKSARYAGNEKSDKENIAKLLIELSGHQNRKAQFRTVICLVFNDKEYLFEGICPGTINYAEKGSEGFGYDPVFIPDGSGKTFAEMKLSEKNEHSHRKKATDKLVAFLNNLIINK